MKTLTNIVSAAEIPRNTQAISSFLERTSRAIKYNPFSLLLTQICMPSSRREVESIPGPLDSGQTTISHLHTIAGIIDLSHHIV